jgi:S1-C subfamily serine protease
MTDLFFSFRSKILFTILLIHFFPKDDNGQTSQGVKINQETYGLITNNKIQHNEYFLGSGFVVKDSFTVITAYHVFKESIGKPKYYCNNIGRVIHINLVDSFPENDIAIYRADTVITYRPIHVGRFDDLRIGDPIIYLAYDLRVESFKGDARKITKLDSIVVNGKTVKRIFFNGDAIGGYSGGPVYNFKGEVIGLMIISIIRGGVPIETIAYSLDPLLNYNRK